MRVAVIGGLNVDLIAASRNAILPGDSNPGQVRTALGGVGRNIAENLCRLGCETALVTVLGDDDRGLRALHACEKLGIRMDRTQILPGERTGTYLCINQPDGDVYAAVADMGIYERLIPERIAPLLPWLNTLDAVVLDANLPEPTIAWLGQRLSVPLAADAVSTPKAVRLLPALSRLSLLKANRPEAAILSGSDETEAAGRLLRAGAQRVFITLGSSGVRYADSRETGICPCFPGPVTDTTGCGDAFIAAALWAMLRGFTLAGQARCGQAAAAICARSPAAVSPDITPENLEAVMRQTT